MNISCDNLLLIESLSFKVIHDDFNINLENCPIYEFEEVF